MFYKSNYFLLVIHYCFIFNCARIINHCNRFFIKLLKFIQKSCFKNKLFKHLIVYSHTKKSWVKLWICFQTWQWMLLNMSSIYLSLYHRSVLQQQYLRSRTNFQLFKRYAIPHYLCDLLSASIKYPVCCINWLPCVLFIPFTRSSLLCRIYFKDDEYTGAKL